MPYFSFSLKQNFFNNNIIKYDFSKIQADTTFFSKNTFLWKNLNNKENKKYINFIKLEKRTKVKLAKGSILFCLPPSIGLGDAIEYGIALNAVCSNKNYVNSAIAFTGRYKSIFQKFFGFKKVYGDIISLKDMSKYDVIFHLFSISICLFCSFVKGSTSILLGGIFPPFHSHHLARLISLK